MAFLFIFQYKSYPLTADTTAKALIELEEMAVKADSQLDHIESKMHDLDDKIGNLSKGVEELKVQQNTKQTGNV